MVKGHQTVVSKADIRFQIHRGEQFQASITRCKTLCKYEAFLLCIIIYEKLDYDF